MVGLIEKVAVDKIILNIQQPRTGNIFNMEYDNIFSGFKGDQISITFAWMSVALLLS